jgi:hypothetical protein
VGRIAGLCLAVALSACAGRQTPDTDISLNFCATRADRMAMPLNPARPGQAEALVARGLDPDMVETADVIGALGALEDMLAAERRADGGISLLLARQALHDRVLLAMLGVQTAFAALDCEDERGDRLRGQLQRIDARRTRNLGLANVLIGAATAVAAGGLSIGGLANASDIAGIIGGSAGAVAGGMVLFATTSGTLRTHTNLLDEVWRQPEESALFPPTVWRYLTRRDAPGQPNLADEIKQEWIDAGLVDDEDGNHALVFSSDGVFTIDDLERRDAMLQLLEARVTLMSRDLRLLLEAIVARPAVAMPAARQARGARAP